MVQHTRCALGEQQTQAVIQGIEQHQHTRPQAGILNLLIDLVSRTGIGNHAELRRKSRFFTLKTGLQFSQEFM
jgi:hypothetical protein